MKQDINNPPAKSPVDDLFAHWLRQHRIAPDKAGWERLQAKMTKKQEPSVLTFWQNPAVYRYAAAACVSALLLAGGWLLLRPDDGVATRQNPVAASQTSQKAGQANSMRNGRSNLGNRIADQQLTQQQPVSQQPVVQQPATVSLPEQPEKMVAQTKRAANRPTYAIDPIGQDPDGQVTKNETVPTPISQTSVPTKPVAEQVLIVTIAEPDALIEARQAANWSESVEKTLVVDVAQKPTKGRRILQQVARVRNGDGIELAGDADQGLLSRAFQTIKNKANNKPLKQ